MLQRWFVSVCKSDKTYGKSLLNFYGILCTSGQKISNVIGKLWKLVLTFYHHKSSQWQPRDWRYVSYFSCCRGKEIVICGLWPCVEIWTRNVRIRIRTSHKLAVNTTKSFDLRIKIRQMQQYARIYLLQNYSICFGCHSTHHQEY